MYDKNSTHNAIQNTELYNKSKEFLQKALSVIGYSIKKDCVMDISIEYKIHDEGYSYTYNLKPNFDVIISKNREKICELSEFNECVNLMHNDPLISPQLEKNVGTVDFFGHMRDPWNILSHMLFRLSEKYHREKNFDESLFKSLFMNFEEFISSNTFLILIIAPLHNFDSERELIKLDNEVTIRKITNYEKERLLRAAEYLRVTPPEITQLKYVIEHKFESDKLIYDPSNNPLRRDKEKTLKAIITALHLFKNGAVNYITRQSESKLDFPGLAGGIESYTSQCPLPGETYILTKSEINKFRKFGVSLRKLIILILSHLISY